MAIPGPVGKDNLEISFRLQSKSQVFDGSTNTLINARLDLLASANTYGLLFVGSANAEIFVVCSKDLESPIVTEQNAPVRKVPMPSKINQLATNCDGSILAVDTKINEVSHIQLYSVVSFLSPNVQKLSEFRVSTDNSSSIQLCWNPCLPGLLAVCTENGGLNLYSFKDQSFNLHTIDQSLKAKCCCWSPKGKQIVAGFSNGKLIQFNLELKPARIIECPPGIFPGGNFDVINVQWLSTYQFAIAFLSHQKESRPIFHILNAPKAGPPQYISYNDVCYSTSETRPSKIYIQHIQAWGLLLVASANCIDISFLRISKAGDIPEWIQEFPDDQFPGELPLTPEKDESFPCGFEINTACSNKLLREDGNPFPIMPMIHIVSTYGVLCSFYVFNSTQSYVDICSPPRPLDPKVQTLFTVHNFPNSSTSKGSTNESIFKTPIKSDPAPISHSTPSIPKVNNLFGVPTTSVTSSTFSLCQTNTFSGFSLSQTKTQQQPVSTVFSIPSSKPIPNAQVTIQSQSMVVPQQNASISQNKTLLSTPTVPNNQPLITVPSNYNPHTNQQKNENTNDAFIGAKLAEAEDDKIYVQMIQEEVNAFELELKFLMEKSRLLKVCIGTKEESAEMRKKLEELDDLKKEATETIESLKSDVQTMRVGLTEMFSMVYEAKAKSIQANNEKSIIMSNNQVHDRSMKRTLDKLKKMISQCEMQINIVVQLLNSQWANYQDTLNKNRKNKMHIPSLDGVYQTLTKQQEIVYNLNGKLKLLKNKLGISDDIKKVKNATIESLSDSIISMSLIDQVQNEKSKMTIKKHKNLLNYLENREVVTIKPQRPRLPGLNSEIIIEKRMRALKNLKKAEPKKDKIINPPLQKETKPIMTTQLNQSIPKIQPENSFNFQSGIQKSSTFTPVTISSQSQINLNKREESKKSISGIDSRAQPSFGLNLNIPKSSNVSSLPPPTIGASSVFSSTLLVSNAEKKQEEQKIQLVPQMKNEIKPASSVLNSDVNVSANFSFSLPSKTSEKSSKDSLPEEKTVDEPKLLTSNESTTFTFSLPSKKDTTLSNPTSKSSIITFGSNQSPVVSDNVKSAFSFNTQPTTFGFGNTSKTSESSIFVGSSAPSFGFATTSKPTPTATTNIFTSANLPQAVTKTVEEAKTNIDTKSSDVTSSTESVSTTSIFGTKMPTSTDSKSSFSFASFENLTPATKAVSTSTTSSLETPLFSSPKSESVSSSVTQSDATSSIVIQPTGSILDGLTICSPTTDTTTTSKTATSTSNVFASPLQSAKSDTTSIFGGSSFANSFGISSVASTQSSIFSSSTTAPPITKTILSQPATTPQTLSTFGSLDLTTKPASPGGTSSNIFGSTLAKPDQSVFGQPATTTSSPSIGNFNNIFAAAAVNAPKSTNVFGTPSSTPGVFNNVTQSSSIFGSSTGQTNQSSLFSQNPTTSSGSIFSQGSFSSPSAATNTSIFGGSGNVQSAFGSSSIFGSSASNTQQSSSIFGGSNAFGGQGNNTSTNIFGAPASTNTGTNPFGSNNIFTQAAAPTFGGGATFGNTLGQSSFGSTGGSLFNQQNQPVFGGTPSFGSPKANIFGSPTASVAPTGNIFEQLGSQQTGNLFGSLAQTSPPQIKPQQSGFSGSAFSSWR